MIFRNMFPLLMAAALLPPLQAASLPTYEVDRKAASKYDFSALRARMKAAVEKGELPGGSVLIMHRDKVVFKEAFGLIDIENKMPFRTDSVCHMASSTKWVSGALLMAAVDEGKLSLDDPIGKYYPQFADMRIPGSDKKGNPSIRQCFSHTSGMPGFTDYSITRDHSVPESIELISKTIHSLDYEPGTAFRYGNTSMQVVGGIICQVTGKSFQDYLREKILGPLGMMETTFNPAGKLIERIGKAYSRKPDGGFQVVAGRRPDGHTKGALVAGGLYSTLDDYARFLTMMLHDGRYGGRKVLSAQAALETQKDQTGGAPVKASPYKNQKGYGLGAVVMGADANGKPVYIGDGGAFGTYGWIDREQDLAGVFFAQEIVRDIYALSIVDVPSLARQAVQSRH